MANDLMISNVIGTPFAREVLTQFIIRAAENSRDIRETENVLFLANKTAWVRLLSSVDIILNPDDPDASQQYLSKYYEQFGIENVSQYPDKTSLAQNWVLEAGTSKINGTGIDLRYGIGGEGSYGFGSYYPLPNTTNYERQGYKPMPGLTSVTIDTAGRLGSLRVAKIDFKVSTLAQLNVIEALYFRLGYSMLLEWGHTQYYTNGDKFVATNQYGIPNPLDSTYRKEKVQQLISKHTRDTFFNYDGMLGVVSSFTWAFNQEGGYDCTVNLIGLGSIIDTLRINQAYTLPPGLLQGYQNALKRLQAKRDEAIAQAAAAAAAAAAARGGGGGSNFTPPNPPKNASELLTITKQYESSVVSTNLTVDDFNRRFGYYSVTNGIGFDNIRYYNSEPDYYFKSQNGLYATQLDSVTYGLFLTKGTTDFKSRTAVNSIVGANLYLNMDVIAGFYDAYINPAFNNLSNTYIDYFKKKEYVKDGTRTTTLKEKITWALNQDLTTFNYSTLTYDDITADKPTDSTNDPYNTSAVTAKIVDANTTKDFFIKLEYPGVSKPFYDSRGNFKGNYIPTKAQVMEAVDDFFNKARSVSTAQPLVITDVEIGTYTVQQGARDPNGGLIRSFGRPVTKSFAVNGVNRSIVITAKAKITVNNVKPPVGVYYDSNGILVNAPTDNLTFDLTIKFNNTGFIKSISPSTPPQALTNNVGGGANTNTGTANAVNSDQSNEAFDSALVAMLAYVKTTTQALVPSSKYVFINTKDVTNKKYQSLYDATKVFYGDGILRGVIETPLPPLGGPAEPFDILKYAQKGFNASLMINENLYGSIPNVNFEELCKAYLIRYEQIQGVKDIATSQVYIKFGYLLAFLNNMCLIYDSTRDSQTGEPDNDEKHPYVYIDFNPETNFCLTSPQQMSIDPTICMIPFQGNSEDYKGIYNPEIYKTINKPWNPSNKENYVSPQLPQFQSKTYQGKIMEILLNVDYLIKMARDFATGDPEHSVNLKRYLEAIVVDVNKSLGNFNLFRVAYIDEANTVQIRDDQYSPDDSQETLLNKTTYGKTLYKDKLTNLPLNYKINDLLSLKYGQLPILGLQSIVRNFEFKTNLSTRLSSMIAISAQAATGSVNAKDGSPLAHLNQNYQDRYKPRVVNPSIGSTQTTGAQQKTKQGDKDNNAILAQTFDTHVKSIYGNPPFNFIVDKIQTAKNYYIERSAVVKTTDKHTIAAPFIPADLEITVDGISGILMGQAFTVPEDILPLTLRGYDGVSKVGFIITGLTHTIENNEWLTKIKGQMVRLQEDITINTVQQLEKLAEIKRDVNNRTNNYKPEGTGISSYKELVASAESNGNYNLYNFDNGNKTAVITPNNNQLVDNTIQQILDWQRNGQILAAGKYQFVNTVKAPTLSNTALTAGVNVNTLFNEATQENLMDTLVLTSVPAIGNYLKGKNTGTQSDLVAAVQATAQTFASLPVINRTDRGTCIGCGNVEDGSGNSGYYGGVGANRAVVNVTVGQVVKALIKSRLEYSKVAPQYIPDYAK